MLCFSSSSFFKQHMDSNELGEIKDPESFGMSSLRPSCENQNFIRKYL